MRKRLARAFTLVELLVVIGIIALLIALVMPALSKARKQALAAACAANLRTIGQAMTMYTQQYGVYPSHGVFTTEGTVAIWPIRLRFFTGGEQGVFYCPAQDERCQWKKVPLAPGAAGRATAVHAPFGYEVGEPILDYGFQPFSYGYNNRGASGNMSADPPNELHKGLGDMVNAHPLWAGVSKELRANRVRLPAEMIAVTDSNADSRGDFQSHPTTDVPWEFPGAVHSGGANVLFCDGHVQWYPQKALIVTDNKTLEHEQPIHRMWNNDHSGK